MLQVKGTAGKAEEGGRSLTVKGLIAMVWALSCRCLVFKWILSRRGTWSDLHFRKLLPAHAPSHSGAEGQWGDQWGDAEAVVLRAGRTSGRASGGTRRHGVGGPVRILYK